MSDRSVFMIRSDNTARSRVIQVVGGYAPLRFQTQAERDCDCTWDAECVGCWRERRGTIGPKTAVALASARARRDYEEALAEDHKLWPFFVPLGG